MNSDLTIQEQLVILAKNNQSLINNNYCLFGLLDFISILLQGNIDNNIKIQIYTYFETILYLQKTLKVNKIMKIEEYMKIVSKNKNKIIDLLKMEEKYFSNPIMKILINYHLYFTKDDFSKVEKLLTNVTDPKNTFYLGASLEQVFFIDEIYNKRKIKNIPFSGNIFTCINDNCIIDYHKKEFIDKNYIQIVEKLFPQLISTNKKYLWDYFHKGRSALTLIYLFKLYGILDTIYFNFVVTDEEFIQDFISFISRNNNYLIAELGLNMDNVNITYHHIIFDNVKTTSYMINSDQTPDDFYNHNRNVIMKGKYIDFLYQMSCSRCTPIRNINEYKEYYTNDIYTYVKNNRLIKNYIGCNYGRLFILIYYNYYNNI